MDSLFLQSESILLFAGKIGIILFMVIYVIFAAIIIKQVRMMTETLELGFETQIKTLVLLHFVFSLIVLVMAFVIL